MGQVHILVCIHLSGMHVTLEGGGTCGPVTWAITASETPGKVHVAEASAARIVIDGHFSNGKALPVSLTSLSHYCVCLWGVYMCTYSVPNNVLYGVDILHA